MRPISTSLVPKSKFLGLCCGILISCFIPILCMIPFYFLSSIAHLLKGKTVIIYIVVIYSIAVYVFVPFAIGMITTLVLSHYKKGSLLGSILYSQLSLIISFITWGMIFQPPGYAGAFFIMYYPLSMLFALMGTVIEHIYLLRKGKIGIH